MGAAAGRNLLSRDISGVVSFLQRRTVADGALTGVLRRHPATSSPTGAIGRVLDPRAAKLRLLRRGPERYKPCLMLSLRFAVLFIHIVAVIVALGGSLFSTFALAPVLAAELDPPARLRVARRIVRRLGAIVLTSLAVLVVTGIFNVLFIGGVSILLAIKLILVIVVIGLALYQYGSLGVQIWRLSAAGPSPEVANLQARFRRVGLTVGSIVLLIIYLSIGLTRGPAAIVGSIR